MCLRSRELGHERSQILHVIEVVPKPHQLLRFTQHRYVHCISLYMYIYISHGGGDDAPSTGRLRGHHSAPCAFHAGHTCVLFRLPCCHVPFTAAVQCLVYEENKEFLKSSTCICHGLPALPGALKEGNWSLFGSPAL